MSTKLRHKEESDIECSVCKTKFTQRKNLYSHIRTVHKFEPLSRIKEHECEECKKKFTKKSSLYFHKRTIHKIKRNIDYNGDKEESDIECSVCKAKFTQRKTLNLHIQNQHKFEPLSRTIEHEREDCKNKNTTKNMLETHNNEHNYAERPSKHPRLTCPSEDSGEQYSRYNILSEHLEHQHNFKIGIKEHNFSSFLGSSTKKEDTVLLLDATATRGTTPCITVTSSSADAPSECALLDNESGEEGTPDVLVLTDDDVTLYEGIDGDDDDQVAVNSDNDDDVQVEVNSDNGGDKQVAANSDNHINDDGTAPETRARFACNVCLRPIVGFRYSCVECVYFDMCSSCEARGEHALHFVLRVPTGRPQARVGTVIAAVRLALVTTDFKEEPEVEIEQDADIQPDPLAPSHTDLDTHYTIPPCLDPSETESTKTDYDIPKLTEIKKRNSKRRKCNLRLNQDESSSDSEDIEAKSEEIMDKYLEAATEKRLLESDLCIHTKAVKRRRLLTKVQSIRNPRELSFRSRKRYTSKDD